MRTRRRFWITQCATLARLLEAVKDPAERRVIAGNRGTGLVVAATLLRRIGLSPPELVDRVHRLTATLSNDGLLDEDALRWLDQVDVRSLNERQRLALVFARRQGSIDNRPCRTVTGCDAATATRELAGLASTGLVEKRGDRRGKTWASPTPGDTWLRRHLGLLRPTGDRAGAAPDRRQLIMAAFQPGPLSPAEIAAAVGVGKRSALQWLVRLESEGWCTGRVTRIGGVCGRATGCELRV